MTSNMYTPTIEERMLAFYNFSLTEIDTSKRKYKYTSEYRYNLEKTKFALEVCVFY